MPDLDKALSLLDSLAPDCGDNSCYFAVHKGGQRTNGGCRCLEGLLPGKTRRYLVLAAQALRMLREERAKGAGGRRGISLVS